METGIKKAVRLAGNQTALAVPLGVTPQAVQKWVAQGFAPAERCREIERLFKGAVRRCDLNPAIFGEDPDCDKS
jgi:DNA-binding transcriptional regulator YdaS (Cro superfamily)